MADDGEQRPGARRRRRAVGPTGAIARADPLPELDAERAAERAAEPDDDERLRRDLPPHHDRGV